ncbi:hypothetical protein OIU76_005508 [Salix suchowensis]|uniref:Uncharacterized protein n=1 Tax=Salix koriyanagi TaxID=2511006 RepID=A0A9Q0U4H9_9ROSI|nr:hypothetical protein OIU76_005508 [Salix suchowensis]KAJ6723320.1 hypothetical protein OIU74_007811 [Salix koriyanagi]
MLVAIFFSHCVFSNDASKVYPARVDLDHEWPQGRLELNGLPRLAKRMRIKTPRMKRRPFSVQFSDFAGKNGDREYTRARCNGSPAAAAISARGLLECSLTRCEPNCVSLLTLKLNCHQATGTGGQFIIIMPHAS